VLEAVTPHPLGWTQALLAALDERTAIVAVPHCHWHDGTLIDLLAVGVWAREVRAALVVDASQSLGVLPLDVAGRRAARFRGERGAQVAFGPGSLDFLYVAPRWQQGRPLEESPYGREGGRAPG
jgi:selenocysteine lyase/cysteine desulfurase